MSLSSGYDLYMPYIYYVTYVPCSMDIKQLDTNNFDRSIQSRNTTDLHFVELILSFSIFNLLASSLCQNLLDSLLLFQKECSHDTRLDTGSTGGSTISPSDGSFALLEGVNLARLYVLDSLQNSLTVTASGSLGGLVDSLRLELTTGSADASNTMLSGVVRVAGVSCESVVRHFGMCL